MPWSKSNTIPSLKNKSDKVKEVFAEAGNAALERGQSEEEAVFAGLAAVRNYERKHQVKKQVVDKPKLPAHLLAVLQRQEEPEEVAKVVKAIEEQTQTRQIKDIEFDQYGHLVITFDDFSQLKTKGKGITEYIESYSTVIAGLTNPVEHIEFLKDAAFPVSEGQLAWNATDGTLDLGLGGGNVTLQIGQEQVVHVYNNTASAFTDLHVLRITGSQGQRLTGALAQANSEITSSTTFAIVTEPIAKNAVGFATTSGLVRNVNTSAFPEGAALYLSPTIPGGLTHIKPVAPNHMVLVGWCVRSNANNGSVYVHVQNGFELDELHNVKITDLQNGHILKYDSALGYWKNVNPAAASGVTTASFFQKVNITAGVALVVSHNLGLIDQDAFTINTMLNGKSVNVEIESVDTNSVRIISAVDATSLAVTIVGVIA